MSRRESKGGESGMSGKEEDDDDMDGDDDEEDGSDLKEVDEQMGSSSLLSSFPEKLQLTFDHWIVAQAASLGRPALQTTPVGRRLSPHPSNDVVSSTPTSSSLPNHSTSTRICSSRSARPFTPSPPPPASRTS